MDSKPAKILYLTPSVPYPPHTGGQIRSFHLLKYLATKGQVTLVSIGQPNQCEIYMPELKKYCSQVLLADPKKFESERTLSAVEAIPRRLGKLMKLEPWLLNDFVDPEILKQIELTKPETYDVIVCRFALMAYYFLTQKKYRHLLNRLVIDIDDLSMVVQKRRVRATSFGYRKLRSLLDIFLLKRYY